MDKRDGKMDGNSSNYEEFLYNYCMLCETHENNEHDSSISDLQLAAELGKSLLERNKELENLLRISRCTVEEQEQEIEYMKKQVIALKDINDSRLKACEQLEIHIQDLEKINNQLIAERDNSKKTTKSQAVNIETLEAKCEDLQKKLDEQNARYSALLHQQSLNTVAQQAPKQEKISPQKVESVVNNDEEMTELLQQLQESRTQRKREQMQIAELSEELTMLLQENSMMEEQLKMWRNKAENFKSLEEEISTLKEVEQGNICARCLRGMDTSRHLDEMTIIFNQEDDEISLSNSYLHDTYHDELMQLDSKEASPKEKETDENEDRNAIKKLPYNSSVSFLEAEALSSTNLIEVSNKAIQTDGSSGFLLCSIANDNIKLSIYDENSSVNSKFQQTPEYCQLFNEIVEVMKRASVTKNGRTQCLLLDNKPLQTEHIASNQVQTVSRPLVKRKQLDFLSVQIKRRKSDQREETPSNFAMNALSKTFKACESLNLNCI